MSNFSDRLKRFMKSKNKAAKLHDFITNILLNKQRYKKVQQNIQYLRSRFFYNPDMQTSISDDGFYPQFCYLASQDREVFNNFRRNSVYTRVLEHVTEEYGKQYLDVIFANSKIQFDADDWRKFKDNDLYGNPAVSSYQINENNILVSPTTIRYVKVLTDVISKFDTENIHSIAEIGIGYGGQCRIIKSALLVETYTLFDLPEVLGLAEEYLNNYQECKTGIRYVDGKHIYINDSYDFVISNYAFSELRRRVQDEYLEKVILRSKSGYITWNSLSYKFLDGYSVSELLELIPDSHVIEERPLTSEENCIIIWGNKK